jgi:hypothetical protein
LAAIETEAGNLDEAANAKREAVECYLAYRRDGGENHDIDGRISLEVTKSLLAGDEATATSFLQQIAAEPEATGSIATFISALQAIVAGSRDLTLADAPDLDYGMAAEILLLIETLKKQRTKKSPVRTKKSPVKTKKSPKKSP